MHRMGPKKFAMIRQKLLAKKDDGEEVTQAEMFIETRQPQKGKTDEETEAAVAKLQDSIQDSSQSPNQVFQSLFGKEKPGKVRCFERTATSSMLKKNEEIANIKKHYEGEMTRMKERMEAYESLTKKRMEAYESLLKCVLLQQNPNLSVDDVDNMMGHALGIENSAVHHSSTSTHVPKKFRPKIIFKRNDASGLHVILVLCFGNARPVFYFLE
ncbi:putative transposase, Ptta/En/Spm, plant [Medicago truncatula]|uniref:Putative transposase, Ptta/En/Spm, plant n=1 Tax=Medicago truncatula TaxID=3880 RepID=A0A396JCE0_MEDTR|nr:putative transposase, Ptta/En/Spm, plant [Medicago truncatula]